MFKECLIDIDFNLLVLNIISLLEMSLLPGPASLGALRFPLCSSWGAAASLGFGYQLWVSSVTQPWLLW